MTRKTITLGSILVELGRLTPEQVEAALAEQAVHGGYFGAALIRLGYLTRDELRWTLAKQYDLPFVHLQPESVDRSLVARVPVEWARTHHTLPVLRDGDRVIAVLEDVADLERLDELARLTGARAVEPSLTSPAGMRDLIDAVYGPDSRPADRLLPVLEEALSRGARAVGLSVRGDAAVAWYRIAERVYSPLAPGWEAELADALSDPAPLADAGADHRAWPALLSLGAESWVVECEAVGRDRALEWSARPLERLPQPAGHVSVAPDLQAEALRTASRGTTLVRVASTPEPGAGDLVVHALPSLPPLLLGAAGRSIHLCDRPTLADAGTLVLRVGSSLAETLGRLASFAPPALTVDVDTLRAGDEAALRTAAPVVFVRTRARGDAPHHPDFSIRLHSDAGGLTWVLEGQQDGVD